MTERFSDDELMRYVLGELGEPEQARLEEAYFADDGLYERLRAVEEELAEVYVRGELAPDARRRLEERLGRSETLRERSAFARTLVAALVEPAAAPPSREPSRGWLAHALEVLSGYRLGIAMAVAVLVLVSLAGLWLAREGSRPTLPQPETTNVAPPVLPPIGPPVGPIDPVPPEPPKPPKPPSAIATFVLTPGVSRSGGAPTELRVPAGTRSIRLRLPLAEPVAGDVTAALRSDDGRVVWRSGKLRARRVAEVTVPVKVLARGAYVVTLERATTEGDRETVEAYAFSVRHE